MPSNESQLKKLVKELMEDALKCQIDAFKEIVEADYVANKYVDAITRIRTLCEDRKRY